MCVAPKLQEMMDSKTRVQLPHNTLMMQQILGNSADIVRRDLQCGASAGVSGALYFVDGLVDERQLEEGVLRPLLTLQNPLVLLAPQAEAKTVTDRLLLHSSISTADTYKKAVESLLSGDVVLFLDDYPLAFIISVRGGDKRAIEEPQTESILRGPRDGFTEHIRTNTALLRRRIKDPALRIESLIVGERTRTDVNIAYVSDLVKPGLVAELYERIQRIRIDAVLESGYVEELIEDAPFSPFPTLLGTERPDRVAAGLLEGRVAVFVDNTPFVLLMPSFFWEFFHASDDYYMRYIAGSFFRVIRYIALFISLTLSSFYVLLVSFHQEMIPTQLALTIAAGRESVPFPVLIEVLLMETAFELMREAGVRMPKPVGQAASIVGSLVIGQAAVQAGIVSPIMVIIIAISGISSFVIPNFSASFSIRFMRIPLIIASGTLGLLGFLVVFFMLTIHLLSLRSFGEPYLAPTVPFRPADQKDSLFRAPWWAMRTRPSMAQGATRSAQNQRPTKPADRSGGAEDGST